MRLALLFLACAALTPEQRIGRALALCRQAESVRPLTEARRSAEDACDAEARVACREAGLHESCAWDEAFWLLREGPR